MCGLIVIAYTAFVSILLYLLVIASIVVTALFCFIFLSFLYIFLSEGKII
jgi:hypothetical protein